MFPVPQNSPCFPVPFIFRLLFPCFPKKMVLSPYSPKPLRGPQYFSFYVGTVFHSMWELCAVSVPLFHWNKPAFFLNTQNQNLDFLCSLFHKIAFVSMSPSFLDFCSLVFLKMVLSAYFPKPLGGPQYFSFYVGTVFVFTKPEYYSFYVGRSLLKASRNIIRSMREQFWFSQRQSKHDLFFGPMWEQLWYSQSE